MSQKLLRCIMVDVTNRGKQIVDLLLHMSEEFTPSISIGVFSMIVISATIAEADKSGR